MKIHHYISIAFFLGLFIMPLLCISQESSSKDLGSKVVVDATKKEEIHRYMGYERLLPKYLSLPYDVNMNTNIKGAFVDIGYLFLMFLPIILLTSIRGNWPRICIVFLLFIFLLFSIPTGYSAFNNISVFDIQTHLDTKLAATSFSTAPLMFFKLKITQFFSAIYLPLDQLIAPISGEGDFITLPIIFSLFVLLFMLIEQRVKFSDEPKQMLVYLTLCYCFLWLILGAGIVWYGILFTALGIILISLNIFKYKYVMKWLSNTFLAFSFLWIILAFSNRLSNYSAPNSAQQSKGAILDATLVYGTGAYNKQQIMDILFPMYKLAVDEINKDPSVLVYRVGTFLHYFIDKNNNRVLEDNQLGVFNRLSNTFQDKQELTTAFKVNNYKFLVIDLNTATIDRTPDKSLTRKYERLLDFVQDNPNIRLIATDSTIKNGKVQKIGNFAVFKII